MPEGPVLKAWWHRISRTLEAGEKAKNPVKGRIILYPRCFTVGTSVKDYVSCTAVQEHGYTPDMDAIPDVQNEHTFPTMMDFTRSKGAEWEYMLQPRLPGTVHVAVLGKIMAITAGHHAVIINFGLEASVMKVSTADFAALTSRSQDVPGPNKNAKKSEKMRSFSVPDKFKDYQSSDSNTVRRLNIFFALECSDGNVWLFVDHVRLIRFHLISRGKTWCSEDLRPESMIWKSAWDGKYGPSWFSEPDLALQMLAAYRSTIQSQVDNGHFPITPLVDVISENMAVFNGFGKHTAHDVLHDLAIFPLTPVWYIGTDDALYTRLRDGLKVYTDMFNQPEFFNLTAAECNSPNPFTFHTRSDEHYIGRYVRVYRRQTVRVPQSLYNLLVSAGLLDPEHIIGEPYRGPMQPTSSKYKFIPVWLYRHIDQKRVTYSVIQACPPKSWNLEDWKKSEVDEDIRTAGKRTTLGVAQFHQYNANIPYAAKPEAITGLPGRRATIHTGKRGRPAKVPTVSNKRALAARGKKTRYPETPRSDHDDGFEPASSLTADMSTSQVPDGAMCRMTRSGKRSKDSEISGGAGSPRHSKQQRNN